MDKQADIKLSFTAAERIQVRNALLRYLTEHQIGVPTLWKRVNDHDPRGRFLAMRTLQRFIARAHQTQDGNVSICYAFAKDLPYFGEERPAAELGQALSRFYDTGAVPDTDGPWTITERIVLEARRLDLTDTSSGIGLVPSHLKTDDLPVHGVIVLDPSEDGTYYRIFQIMTIATDSAETSPPTRLLSQGVSVPTENHNMVTVEKDALTRRPRNGDWLYDESYVWHMTARYLMPQLPSGRSDPLHRGDTLRITCKPGGEDAVALVEKFLEVNS